MKISRIYIKDYNQFNNIELDLTYPKGHPREGLPLQKVCFIGQSGTGKTTLLNIVWTRATWNFYKLHPLHSTKQNEVLFEYDSFTDNEKTVKNTVLTDDILKNEQNGYQWGETHYYKDNIKYSNKQEIRGIYFPVPCSEKMNQIFSVPSVEDPLRFIATDKEIQKIIDEERKELYRTIFFDFGKDDIKLIWKSVLLDASDYMVKALAENNNFAKAAMSNRTKAAELAQKLAEWHENNPSPFNDIDNALQPILSLFNLRIKTGLDFAKKEDLEFIKIETLQGEEVPVGVWSTGTKQIISTAIPLFKLNTWESLILIDEPESSLYPDIQQMLVDYYSGLAPEAQFFYATHSPIIASAFEPWEVVELKWDYEAGKVVQNLWYEGDRDVKNYTKDPRYLSYGDIISQVYHTPDAKREEREQEIMELLTIKSKLKNNNLSEEERATLYNDFKNRAKRLNWNLSNEKIG